MPFLIVLGWLALEALSVFLVGELIGLAMALWLMAVICVVGLSLLGRAREALDPSVLLMRGAGQGFPGVMDKLAPLLAGVLLAVPGYFSDLLALTLLIPGVRRLLLKGVVNLGHRYVQRKLGAGAGLPLDLLKQLGNLGQRPTIPGDPFRPPDPKRDRKPPPKQRPGEKVIDADYEVIE